MARSLDLLGTAYVLDVFARVIAPGGAGIVVASMAGHRESAYPPEIEHALATTETSRLLALPFLRTDRIGTSVHAYALSKRANSLRVQTAAAAWGRRGARVNAVSPGVIITDHAVTSREYGRETARIRARSEDQAGRLVSARPACCCDLLDPAR
ncbi:SDR family oxidoreductase [Streptomyces sp. NBC_00280]|uniref:SDR family oxidoreductase n=1 Tax=Streptomyces sp. NBC_00280 TaxID=2975699 RepID=UPI003254D93B